MDFDSQDALLSWQAERDPIDTYQVETSRGWHLYFYVEEKASCWHGDGVDLKAAGGYVLAPPSVHPSGHIYRGYGSPELIAKIASIKDILPAYNPPVYVPVTHSTDPYDMAMRQDCGISVASIKAAWRWEDVLSVNGTARRVMMVSCPFHADEHASMALYPDKHAHCFGCGLHLDILDFYAMLHNLTIQEAMREMRR